MRVRAHDAGVDAKVRQIVATSVLVLVLVLDELTFHSWFYDPVASFTRVSFWSLLFLECLVQRQIMSDAVVPALLGVLAIIRKGGRDPIINLC